MSEALGFIGVLVGVLWLGGVIHFVFFDTSDEVEEEYRQEAIARGHAEYVITDPKTGATEFRWKEKPKSAP